MDELDIYDDLDEFHEQEEKKSKELLALEAKYEEALKTIEAMKMEKKDLRKKIRIMEQNFQSLLDTAKAEVKRKDNIIANLHKEKDDLCFRRQRVPQKSRIEQWGSADTLLISTGERNCNPFKSYVNKESQKPATLNENRNQNKAVEENPISSQLAENELCENNATSTSENKTQPANSPESRDPNQLYEFESQTSHKNTYHKYDNETVVEKRDSRYRERHRDTYKDVSKFSRRKSRDKSSERSSRTRYEEKISNRRKNDKYKFEKHYNDDHSSYRKHKNKRKDRSRSSDRHDKSDCSHRLGSESTKSSRQSEKKNPHSESDKERRRDRSHMSYPKEDNVTDYSRDKSKSHKRRRSSDREEGRHKKHAHVSRESKDENVDHKYFSDTENLTLENIGSSDDDFDIENYSFATLKGNLDFKQTDLESTEKDQCLVGKRNFSKEDKSVGVKRVENNGKCQQENKNNVALQENRTRGIDKSVINFNESNLNKEDAVLNAEELLQNTNETSTPNESFESSPIRGCLQAQVTSLATSYEAQILIPTEETTQADKDVFRRQQDIEEPTELEEVHKFLTSEKLKPQMTSNSKGFTGEEENKKFDISTEYKNSNDLKMAPPGIILEEDVLPCDDFAEITTKSTKNKDLNSLENYIRSSKKTEEIKSNKINLETVSTVIQESTENVETPEKLSLFDALFGISSFSTNALSGDLLGNAKDILYDGHDSSHTTSPDKYTDISETPSKNSEKNFNINATTKEENKRLIPTNFLPLCNTEILRPGSEKSKLSSNEVNGNENQIKSSSVIEECKYQREHESLKRNVKNFEIPELKVVDEFNKNKHEVEEEIIVEQTKLLSTTEEREVKQLSSNLPTSVEKIQENNANLSMNLNCIVNPKTGDIDGCNVTGLAEPQETKILPPLAEKQSLQVDDKEIIGNSTEKSLEHVLQSVCLVDISEDEVTNSIPSISPSSNQDKKLNIEKSLSSRNLTIEGNVCVEKPTNSKLYSIDQEVIKEINEQCLRLKSASKDKLNKFQVPKDEDEKITSNEATYLQTTSKKTCDNSKQTDEASEILAENLVLESDEEIELVSLPKKNSVEIKVRDSIAEIPTVIELDNENENSSFNLTLSSDDDDDVTIAELQKKIQQQQKDKIQIIENIRLPTLFRQIKCTKPKQSPKKPMKIRETFDTKEKSFEISGSNEKDGILEAKATDPVIVINEKQLKNEKTELAKRKMTSVPESKSLPSNNGSTVIIDITEDSQENRNNEATVIEEVDKKKGIMKESDEIIFKTKDNAKNHVASTEKIQSEELSIRKAIQREDINTRDQAIASLSADISPSSIESYNNRINNETELEKNIEPFTNHSVVKLKTDKQKTTSQKSPTSKALMQNSKSFIKLDVVMCNKDKDRRRLTEHNGKILDDSEKQKQQDSLDENMLENIQEVTTPCGKKRITKQLTSPKSVYGSTPTEGRHLTKEFRIRIERTLKKSPAKVKITGLAVEDSVLKSHKSGFPDSRNTPVKRKHSTSPPTDTLKTKNEKLSTSAEVRAMLIDGKSPKITNDMSVTSPINIMQDTNLDELDKDMQAIFQSPAKFEHTLLLNDCVPCGNSTVLDATIDEALNSYNLEPSVVSETLNKTNDSSFESKRLSLGTTQYVYERVSEDVVNLFITRRRNKKSAKIDVETKQSNIEKA